MISLFARYGIIAGIIVAIPMFWRVLSSTHGDMAQEMLIGYLTMIVGLTAVFLGVKRYRDKVLGGVIKFGPAFGLGLGISVVASLTYAIGWELCMAFGSGDFIASYSQAMIDAARAKGASPAELQKVIAEADSFAKMYANPLIRFAFTFIEMFPVGLLISLISAALLRNPRLLPARAAP
jgi:hypothetical protein